MLGHLPFNIIIDKLRSNKNKTGRELYFSKLYKWCSRNCYKIHTKTSYNIIFRYFVYTKHNTTQDTVVHSHVCSKLGVFPLGLLLNVSFHTCDIGSLLIPISNTPLPYQNTYYIITNLGIHSLQFVFGNSISIILYLETAKCIRFDLQYDTLESSEYYFSYWNVKIGVRNTFVSKVIIINLFVRYK